MKYRRILIVCLWILLLTFTDCSTSNNKTEDNDGIDTPKVKVHTDTPTKTVAPSQTTAPSSLPTKETEEDFYSKYGVESLPKQAVLPSCAEKTETENLYRLKIDLGNMQSITDLSVENDVMFCVDPMLGEELLFNINNGKLLSKIKEQGDYIKNGRFLDGGVWTIVQSNLETTFYDTSGNPTVVRKAEDKGCYGLSYVTLDGKYEIYDNEQGEILVYNFSTGKSKVVYTGSGYNQLVKETNQGCIVSNDYNNYLLIDPNDGTSELLIDQTKDDSDEKYYALWPFLYNETEEEVALYPSQDMTQKITIKKHDEQQYAADFSMGIFVTASNATPYVISFYNLRTEEILGTITSSSDMLLGSVKILDNGFALISSQKDEKIEIYLYDLVSQRKTEQCQVTYGERKQEEESNPLVKELNETYGIKIFYGDKCIVTNTDKKVAPLTDAKQIDDSIRYLKVFLEQLPKGLTQEMYKGVKRGLNIYLGGKITDINDKTISIGGFCFLTGSDRIGVVVDASCSNELLCSTLAHEFSHAFEYKIQDVSGRTGTDYLGNWEKLLPSSIKEPYFNTYHIRNKGMEYTPYGSKKAIWFADEYSRTFPTEDRARMFEYMFMPEDGKISWYIDYKNLKYKARYYSLMLRACFESCKNAKKLVWEQYIGKIDKKEFSSLINFNFKEL